MLVTCFSPSSIWDPAFIHISRIHLGLIQQCFLFLFETLECGGYKPHSQRSLGLPVGSDSQTAEEGGWPQAP